MDLLERENLAAAYARHLLIPGSEQHAERLCKYCSVSVQELQIPWHRAPIAQTSHSSVWCSCRNNLMEGALPNG